MFVNLLVFLFKSFQIFRNLFFINLALEFNFCKSRKFHMIILIQEYITRIQIHMHNPNGMQALQCNDYLCDPLSA